MIRFPNLLSPLDGFLPLHAYATAVLLIVGVRLRRRGRLSAPISRGVTGIQSQRRSFRADATFQASGHRLRSSARSMRSTAMSCPAATRASGSA